MENQTQVFDNDYWASHVQRTVFRHEAALQLLKDVKDPVMDVGCGDGLLLDLMKSQGIEAWGCDHSEAALDACRRRGMVVESCDFAAGVLSSRHARTATVLDVLEHLYEPERLLGALHKSVESLIVGVPNFVSLPARLQVLAGGVPENNRPRQGHVYWFTYHVLHRLLERTGWTVETVKWNVPWAHVPVIGPLVVAASRLRPSVLGLSFVVRAKRASRAH